MRSSKDTWHGTLSSLATCALVFINQRKRLLARHNNNPRGITIIATVRAIQA